MRKRLGPTLAALVIAAIGTASARGDLATFGYGNARSGASPSQGGISPTRARRLRRVWRASLGGAINGQPIIVDAVRVGTRARNLVFVGTEAGEVVAMDANSGAVLWRRELGSRKIKSDCQASPNSVFGITATPVADRRASRLYVIDVDGRAWALDLASGRVAPNWPVRVNPAEADFVYGALALSRGRLYVPVASLCDSGRYHGGIVAVTVAHPRRDRRWRTTAGSHAYGGGIWGWGGVSVDNRTGEIYAATGNSLGTAREDDGNAESVVRLSASLVLQQANHPLRPPYALGDRDFGATPVLLHATGCPPQLVAINKDGELFLYDRDHLSAGPTQRLVVANSSGSIPLYGMPALDPASRTLVLVSPSAPSRSPVTAGVEAFHLTRSCRLVLSWQTGFDFPGAGSAPTIADGVVYIGSGRNGWLRAFRLRDGHQLYADHLSSQAIFAAPSVDRGSVFVGDWTGRVSALRPRP